MKFVLSRSSEPAACRRILEGESPTFLGSRPNCSPTFVAITRSFLRPARAFPTIFSVLPSEYTSAVSKKVIPRSRALAIIFFPSAAVTIHPDSSPNDIHPRQTLETLSPVFPSPTYSTPGVPSYEYLIGEQKVGAREEKRLKGLPEEFVLPEYDSYCLSNVTP